MSVSSQDTVFQHVGNGVSVTFAYGCQVPLIGDLSVYVDDVLTVSGFTINGIGSASGGSVTFDVAPANLVKIRLERIIVLERTTDYPQNGDFQARVVNPDFDRTWMALQQHKTQLARTLQAPRSEPLGPYTLPLVADRADKLLGFDALGNPVAIVPSAQSAAALQALLAASSGAGLSGFSHAETYEDGTLGSKSKMSVFATDAPFNAGGYGFTDDSAAIQAALDHVGANGGGTVYLPRLSATGRYRIASPLRIPSYTTLEGTNPLVFPFSFNNGILADFANPNQWVIESKTTSGGVNIPYNTILDAFPDGATYNCGVRNLRIGAVNTTPYGGVRMHGAFGPIVENVAAAEIGCGFLLNESLGGRWKVHSRALYYGMALWNDCNANEISLYAPQSPQATTVPPAYILPFMAALNGVLVPTYKLTSNAPYEYSTGLIVGADSGVSSQTNTITATIETFSTTVFLLNTKSVVFPNLYIEGSVNDVKCSLIAADSTFNILGCHAFMSGSGTLLDIGNDTRGKIDLSGVPYFATFGTVFTNSNVTISGYDNPAPASPALNVQFASQDAPFIAATLTNSWANAGGSNATAGYRKNQRTGNVELKGFIVSGIVDAPAFTLPVGYRPAANRWFSVVGGVVYVDSGGLVTPSAPTVTQASLDGIQFRAEQ